MLKVHPPLFEGLVRALEVVFAQGHHVDKVIERLFKANRKWGSRDRKIFAESMYEIVRWKGTLQALSQKMGSTSNQAYREWAEIWLSAFQDEFSWQSSFSEKTEQLQQAYEKLSFADRESFAPWFVERLKKEMGDEAEEHLQALNDTPPVFLRVNTLKISAKELSPQLQQVGVQHQVVNHETLMLTQRKNIFATAEFQAGYFEVQDIHSQQAALFLDLRSGECVVDACAGAGGKTLHIAARMRNKGRLISMDVEQKKLDELKRRARRAGVHNIDVRLIDSSKTIKRLAKAADRVLLDVPCSGSGVIRRNPDSKWKLTEARLNELILLQAHILNSYAEMVKPGGTLVYATCSIFPSENGDQVKKFLSQNENFRLDQEVFLSPGQDEGDGFYLARLIRA